ncbi:hypothetical protein UNSWDHB_1192 [Dehalobacter sp. UNSWDHB]|nr:hypothetical protein UNSWDHB_1192 [Dehalobacter sp. UNSWDHB]
MKITKNWSDQFRKIYNPRSIIFPLNIATPIPGAAEMFSLI